MDMFSALDYSFTKIQVLNSCVWVSVGVVYWVVGVNLFFSGVRSSSSLSLMGSGHFSSIRVSNLLNFSGSYVLLKVMFVFLLLSNLLSLVPCVFSLTSQMIVTVVLALLIFLGIVISNFVVNMKSFFGHFVPEGSPLGLGPILSFIELFSMVIRPLTLCLRLSMKLSTGHVLVVLLATSSMYLFLSSGASSAIFCFFVSLVGAGYMGFELGVVTIQAFVFSLLGAQYFDEHSN